MPNWTTTSLSCHSCQKVFLPARWNVRNCDTCRSRCRVDGCGRATDTGGLCGAHRWRMRKYGETGTAKLRGPRGDPKLRRPPSPAITLVCEGCKIDFRVTVYGATDKEGNVIRKFCSRKCSDKAKDTRPIFSCKQCGEVRPRRKNQKSQAYDHRQIYCSTACQHASLYKGGTIDKGGYRIFSVKGRSVPEHREVMSRLLGRPLFPEETVHHRDGQKTNNDPANLELWSSRHGPGQRVSDKIEFCTTFLRDYGWQVGKPAVPVSNYNELACL